MHTLTLKNQVGSLVGPIATMDSRYTADALDDALTDLETHQGLLSAGEMSRLKALYEKFAGGSTVVSPGGAARAADAIDAGREVGARVRRQLEHTAKVASGYRDFWDKKEAELKRYGQR